MKDFGETVASRCGGPLRARALEILQLNVGKKCNQRCAHCHVDAGPDRSEEMSAAVMADVANYTTIAPVTQTSEIVG